MDSATPFRKSDIISMVPVYKVKNEIMFNSRKWGMSISFLRNASVTSINGYLCSMLHVRLLMAARF